MNNLTVIVGDNTKYLADHAHEIDPNAYLVEYSNLEHNHHGVVYTSIADVGVEGLINLLFKATQIVYYSPNDDVWSDRADIDDRFSMAQTSYIYCKIISTIQKSKFETLDTRSPVLDAPPIKPRLSADSNLWIAGCSTTNGSGVTSDQVYWKSISDKLNIPTINLAQPKSSLQWQSDQLLRADLQQGDKVIWGLTYSNRFPWYTKADAVEHLTMNNFTRALTKQFKGIVSQKTAEDNNWHYASMRSIRQVENFCKKLGVELLLVGIHADVEVCSVLCDQSNFVLIDEQCGTKYDSHFLDLGTDNMHPGPLTHQMYREKVLDCIDKLGWI